VLIVQQILHLFEKFALFQLVLLFITHKETINVLLKVELRLPFLLLLRLFFHSLLFFLDGVQADARDSNRILLEGSFVFFSYFLLPLNDFNELFYGYPFYESFLAGGRVQIKFIGLWCLLDVCPDFFLLQFGVGHGIFALNRHLPRIQVMSCCFPYHRGLFFQSVCLANVAHVNVKIGLFFFYCDKITL